MVDGVNLTIKFYSARRVSDLRIENRMYAFPGLFKRTGFVLNGLPGS